MGLFTKKDAPSCAVCGKPCGLIKFKLKNNEYLCSDCNNEANFTTSLGGPAGLTAEEVAARIALMAENKDTLSALNITKSVGDYLKIDEGAKKWYIGSEKKKKQPIVHDFSDIVDFELLEDGNSLASGGLGRAAVGGVLFGGVGAIVGGTTGKKKTKNTCTELKIKITLNSITSPTEYIDFVSGGAEFKRDGVIYKMTIKNAQECLSLLQVMCNSRNLSSPTPQPVSAADEIKKFKELLDIGAITQEEFDQKKKQLLGL